MADNLTLSGAADCASLNMPPDIGDCVLPAKLVTHLFALGDIMKAYDTFGNAAQERALRATVGNRST